MGLIIIYVAGLMSGGMLAWKTDKWRDYKIERYEEVLEIDKDMDGELIDNSYLFEDPYGNVWLVQPQGRCFSII